MTISPFLEVLLLFAQIAGGYIALVAFAVYVPRIFDRWLGR